MDRKNSVVLLFVAFLLSACSDKKPDDAAPRQERPRTLVSLTHAAYGSINETITLSATTMYLNKSVMAAPIPGFIIGAFVQPGTRVRPGTLLYRLESKERHALGEAGNGGVIPISASRGGVVLDVQQQAGSYVTEGATLCTIADVGSLVFAINVPYEQRPYVRTGGRCILVLPDGTRLVASILNTLATMDEASQAEQVIARARAPFLPEGLNVKALLQVADGHDDKGMILPKSAVQSDDAMTNYWVMKLKNDTTAIKVPVTVVRSNATEVEIASGAVSVQDRIVLTGGYGLEDGSRVSIGK